MTYAKSERTRTRLIEATTSLLRRQGYHATGLSEIVLESGVPKGSLYHHFPGGKEELAAAGVRCGGEWIERSLRRLVDRTGSVAAGVAAFCDHYIESLERSGFRAGCPVATVTLEIASDMEGVQREAGIVFERVVGFIASRLEAEGVAARSARTTALVTVSGIEGALILARATRTTDALATVREQLVQHIHGLERTT